MISGIHLKSAGFDFDSFMNKIILYMKPCLYSDYLNNVISRVVKRSLRISNHVNLDRRILLGCRNANTALNKAQEVSFVLQLNVTTADGPVVKTIGWRPVDYILGWVTNDHDTTDGFERDEARKCDSSLI